ncbi:MAG: class I SAM-dependent methyltransferase [Methanomassiliicoccales archaeon]|nr:class I SAM-dependent methyltransferase [Methanomassiliicoccales archaeon]
MKDDVDMMLVNLRRWDEKARSNWNSRYYDVSVFLQKKDSLMPVEKREVGEVKGKDLLHLQCHFGMDTLSWARLGANVTGIDFSPEAIALARELSARVGLPGRFIQANVYDLDKILSKKFDIVFTSYGVLCWLPDLKEWGRLIAERLRPGGFFYIVEGHPFGNTIDDTRSDRFQTVYPYFSGPPVRFDDDHPMDEEHEFQNKERYEWFHPLSDIVNSLTAEDLHIDFLHEFPQCFFQMHPDMVQREDGYWYFQKGGFDVPMLFSIKASKPII